MLEVNTNVAAYFYSSWYVGCCVCSPFYSLPLLYVGKRLFIVPLTFSVVLLIVKF